MSTTKQLTMGEVLEWYDGPVLFLACDEQSTPHVCSLVKNTPREAEYLCSQLEPEMLAALLAGQVDLRFALARTPIGNHWYAIITGNNTDSESFAVEKLDSVDHLADHMLPAHGYYCRKGGES